MLNRPPPPRAPVRRRQRGLSLVAMMVGVTISLFVAGAAVLGAFTSLNENRRLLLDTRVQQDLRAAMTLITRDLRRAGYWAQSSSLGIWQYGNTDVTSNSFADIEIMPARPATFSSTDPVPQTGATSNGISYRWDANGNGIREDDEVYSFDIDNHRLRMRIGADGTWQEVTDPSTVKVTAFSITPSATWLPLHAHCPGQPCTSTTANCPALAVRTLAISISAEAPSDPAVKRTLRSLVRLPNHHVSGACPTA